MGRVENVRVWGRHERFQRSSGPLNASTGCLLPFAGMVSFRMDEIPRQPSEGGGQGELVDAHSTPGRTLDPQRLLRIAGVTREVLEEARRIKPEASAVDHLRRVHLQITTELREALPPELYEELDDLTPEIRDGSLEELALAHAEILGWMEGLFQGTQLALQMRATQAMQRLRQPAELGAQPEREEPDRDSRYL